MEDLASRVVAAGHKEWNGFPPSEASAPGVGGEIARLEGILRQYHHDDDGCLDEAGVTET